MSITEKTVHSEELKLLSWQIANSACRLRKLLELGAPAFIIEHERRILTKRIALLPIATGEAAEQADAIEKIGASQND